jgi:hypothetical protein
MDHYAPVAVQARMPPGERSEVNMIRDHLLTGWDNVIIKKRVDNGALSSAGSYDSIRKSGIGLAQLPLPPQSAIIVF